MNRLLLCSDLDRTLLPNGPQPESPGARALFRDLAARPDLTLTYVTGRHRELVVAAIKDYQLPWPDYVISDVGTIIHTVGNPPQWRIWEDWRNKLLAGWHGVSRAVMWEALLALPDLTAQEEDKQSALKLSFYAPADQSPEEARGRVETTLATLGVMASIVWSVDETTGTGLLDVLPPEACKLHALHHLRQALDFDLTSTLFAGDSGNDLPVLTSTIPAVLPANATEEMRGQAVTLARDLGNAEWLYLARGIGEFNGNYAAGILEGLAHFHPDFAMIPARRQD